MHLLAIVSCDDMCQPVKKGELVKHMKHEISVNHATDNGSKPSRFAGKTEEAECNRMPFVSVYVLV